MRYVIGITVGLLAAAFLNLLSFIMVGAGHGWTSSIAFSLGMLVVCPSVGALVIADASTTKMVLALANLFALFVLDVFLIITTRDEGAAGIEAVFHRLLPVLAAWFLVVAIVHIISIGIAICSLRPRRS
jgi:hypothetical protein